MVATDEELKQDLILINSCIHSLPFFVGLVGRELPTVSIRSSYCQSLHWQLVVGHQSPIMGGDALQKHLSFSLREAQVVVLLSTHHALAHHHWQGWHWGWDKCHSGRKEVELCGYLTLAHRQSDTTAMDFHIKTQYVVRNPSKYVDSSYTCVCVCECCFNLSLSTSANPEWISLFRSQMASIYLGDPTCCLVAQQASFFGGRPRSLNRQAVDLHPRLI